MLDTNKMQWLSPNTAAPFAQVRGYNNAQRGLDGYSGLGQADPATMAAAAQSANDMFKKILGMIHIGQGRMEADQIVPIANGITNNIFAPLSKALEHGDSLSYGELTSMWETITNTEDQWLSMLHGTTWSDGRAAAQAERDFVPYFTNIKNHIRALIQEQGGTLPYNQMSVNFQPGGGGGSGVPYYPGGTSIGGLNLQSVQSYLPWILAGAFIFMLPKIGK